MRLTIHYRGRLRSYSELDVLINDVADICMDVGWRIMPVHSSNIMPAKGWIITPEGCESIWLTYLPNGHLYDVSHFIYTSYPQDERVDEKANQWISTKTQYVGIFRYFRHVFKMYRSNRPF